MELTIRFRDRIDFYLSMYPSFASVLFSQVDNRTWLKELGYAKGVVIKVEENIVKCIGAKCSEEVIKEWSGLWFNPNDHLRGVKRSKRSIVEKLLEVYSNVRIIVSSFDWKIILILVFLSRRTDYHVNVMRWVKTLFQGLDKENYDELIKRIDAIGKSYQLMQLKANLTSLLDLDFNSDPWILRRILLTKRYVGPKVADAFLLFTKKGTIFTPSDVHYQNFVRRIGLAERKLAVPLKGHCLKYDAICVSCPLRNKCLTGWSITVFGKLSGWIQTVAYVHDKLFCMRKLCNKCKLRSICILKSSP